MPNILKLNLNSRGVGSGGTREGLNQTTFMGGYVYFLEKHNLNLLQF